MPNKKSRSPFCGYDAAAAPQAGGCCVNITFLHSTWFFYCNLAKYHGSIRLKISIRGPEHRRYAKIYLTFFV